MVYSKKQTWFEIILCEKERNQFSPFSSQGFQIWMYRLCTFEIWVFKSETKRGYNTTTKYILRLKYGEKFYGKKIADCFWHGSLGFYLYIKKFCWPSVQITTLAALRAKLLSFMDVLKMSDDSHFGLGAQWSIWKNLIQKIVIYFFII